MTRHAKQLACLINVWFSIFTGKQKERTVRLYFSTPHISGYLIAARQGHSSFWMGNKAGTPSLLPESQHSSYKPRELGPLTSCMIETVGKLIKC